MAATHDMFDHDFTVYPEYPGAKGSSETGHEAAAAIASVTARYQKMALAAIRAAGANGLTAHELAERLGLERTTIQPRTSELRRLGKIADSGRRRSNPNGKRAIVWTTPEHVLPAPERMAA